MKTEIITDKTTYKEDHIIMLKKITKIKTKNMRSLKETKDLIIKSEIMRNTIMKIQMKGKIMKNIKGEGATNMKKKITI